MKLDTNFLGAAAFLFEEARGVKLGPTESYAIEQNGLGGADPDTIANQLCDSLKADLGLPPELRATTYWALGKRYDSQLLAFFREALAREIDRDIRVAHQVLVALYNLGEPVFGSDREGISYNDDELNKRDALQYLAKT